MKLSFTIPDDFENVLKNMAIEENKSINEIINDLLTNSIAANYYWKKIIREEFLRVLYESEISV